MARTKAVFLCDDAASLDAVFDAPRRGRLAQLTELHPSVVTSATFDSEAPSLRDVQVVLSTWGLPALDARQLDGLPALRALFYAAGSVRGFARPLLERGVRVFSAWAANAVPVAEFAFSQIVLACKGWFRNTREVRERAAAGCGATRAYSGAGAYGETVALLGCGAIARRLIARLATVDLDVVVYDPYLTPRAAAALGVTSVSLADAFARGYVVSNHVPNLPETVGLLNASLFRSMRRDATFINTGRGATVVEADLIAALRERPDITALLDVTWPEPPAAGSPLYSLPNAWLSSHIAGSKGDEVKRMADFMIEELVRWDSGRPAEHEVTLAMLDRLA
jgi:phosphoglycerate dehydrogenase-like enzyme